jgi:hypothetical protein
VSEFGRKWYRIASHLPRKSADDCEARWNKLCAAAPIIDVEKEEQQYPFMVTQPNWLTELSLVPFEKICSQLDYKQVFGKLPLVCKHFNELLIKNKVRFDKLILRDPSAKLLGRLIDNISTCWSLDLTLTNDHLDKDTTVILTKLLDKFKPSVVEFECDIQDQGAQEVVTSFINDCTRLRFLTIDCGGFDWDWSLHSTSPTVEKLDFQGTSSSDLTKILYVFPGLQSFIESKNSYTDSEDDEDEPVDDESDEESDGEQENDEAVEIVVDIHDNMAMIDHFESRHLVLPVHCLKEVKHLHLYDFPFATLVKLVSYMPQLTALENLELVLGDELFDEDRVAETGQRLKQLIETLPLTLVKLTVRSRSTENDENTYDLRIIKLLDSLPATVCSINYFGFVLKRSASL